MKRQKEIVEVEAVHPPQAKQNMVKIFHDGTSPESCFWLYKDWIEEHGRYIEIISVNAVLYTVILTYKTK